VTNISKIDLQRLVCYIN